jgi:hypothetical protein
MPYLFAEDKITSVAGLLAVIQKDEDTLREALKPKRTSDQHPAGEPHLKGNYSRPPIWYRGLRKISRKLLPTFYREECKVDIKDEIYLMNLFKQNAHEILAQIPNSMWEWMFLMRHHKAPSRLLDWTENPLVALYFAVYPREDSKNPYADDGVLWCLLPNRLNAVSIQWPNDDYTLPMLSDNPEEVSRGAGETIGIYLPAIPTTSGELPPGRFPAAGIAPRTNRRMQVQMSVFTIHHVNNRTPVEQALNDSTHIWRYKVPQEYKEPIYQELGRIGVNRRILFPELDNVAREAKDLLGGD